jgi:hypothetical protein
MSLGSYKKVPVSELLRMIGGPVTPAIIAQRKAQQKANAARRGREALRRTVRKIKTKRPQPVSGIRRPNINTLIGNANAAWKRLGKGHTNANMIDYHKKRNLVIQELSRNNKTPRINEILRNIHRRKNTIASGIDWADVKQRWWTWQEIVAAELGAGPSVPLLFNYNPYNIPKEPLSNWRLPPPGRNTGSITRLLAARGMI